MPKVTVIIPTHNRARLLARAVRSVLAQTFCDFELLVVDDASKDETAQVLRSFTDPRLRCIRHEVNRGESETRNTGIRNAQCEYIAYLDDDDEWLPDKLEKQIERMDCCRPEIGVVYTGMQYVELGSGQRLPKLNAYYRGRVLDRLLESNFLAGPTALVRMECFRTVGMYDPSVRFGPDWEMWIRIAKHFKFEAIPEPLYNYSIHANQLTANYKIQIEGLQRIIEIHKDLFVQYPRAYARQLVQLGVLHYFCGDSSRARLLFKRGLCQYPFSFRPFKLYFLSYLKESSFRSLLAFRKRAVRSKQI